MKVAIILVLTATVLIVNTSAGSTGFKVLTNQLTGNRQEKLAFIQAKIIQESNTQNLDSEVGKTPFSIYTANNLRQSMNAKYYRRQWLVIAVEDDEFYSVSSFSHHSWKDYLDITYMGVRWFIYSFE